MNVDDDANVDDNVDDDVDANYELRTMNYKDSLSNYPKCVATT